MRKKLCIIMAGLILMAGAAGCAGKKDNNNKSSASQASSASSTESTAESKTESKTESAEGSAQTSETSSTEESTENESPFADITYTSFSVDGLKKESGAKLPACFIIKSKAELDDFIEKNENEYMLSSAILSVANGGESNQNFRAYASANYNDDMFNSSDLMIVIAAFLKEEEADLGDIAVEGNKVTVDLWGSEPDSGNEQQFILYSVTYKKGITDGKEPVIKYTGEMTGGEEEGAEEDSEEIVIDGEEGGEEIIIDGEEDGEEIVIDGEEDGEKSVESA